MPTNCQNYLIIVVTELIGFPVNLFYHDPGLDVDKVSKQEKVHFALDI